MSNVSIYPLLPVEMDPLLREALVDILREHAIQINRLSFEVTRVSAAQAVARPIVLADAAGGELNLTLPKAKDWDNNAIRIKKMDASVNAVNILTTNSETIDGTLTVAITVQHTAVQIVSDGEKWVLV